MLCVHLEIRHAHAIPDALMSQQAAFSSAVTHADAPFLHIIDTLRGIDHFVVESSRNPCFQSLCNLQRGHVASNGNAMKNQNVNFCEG
jgi:hypothetical protein